MKVNVVNAGAGAHNNLQGRKKGKSLGGDWRWAHTEEGAHGSSVAGEEGVNRVGLRRVKERVNESEVSLEASAEGEVEIREAVN